VERQQGRWGLSQDDSSLASVCACVGFVRRIRRDSAIIGEVYPGDRWICGVRALSDPTQADSLKLQSFTRLLLPSEWITDMIHRSLLPLLANHGVALVTPPALGQEITTGEAGRPQVSLVAILPHILIGGLGDGDEEVGQGS
jgi:hypothetical protein